MFRLSAFGFRICSGIPLNFTEIIDKKVFNDNPEGWGREGGETGAGGSASANDFNKANFDMHVGLDKLMEMQGWEWVQN